MRDFNRRRSRRQEILGVILKTGGLLLLFAVTFVAARAAWGMYGKFSQSAAADAAVQQNLASLEAQEAQMNAQVNALNSPRGQEAQLREEYGVAKPGEGEIDVVQAAASTTPQAPPPQNIFSRIFHALFPF